MQIAEPGRTILKKKLKATGKRGSWFAEVGGHRYPCVHKYWLTGTAYHDPDVVPGFEQSDELAAAIERDGMVVLCKDDARRDHNGKICFSRLGYIASYAVDFLSFDEGGLRFTLTKRVDELA